MRFLYGAAVMEVHYHSGIDQILQAVHMAKLFRPLTA